MKREGNLHFPTSPPLHSSSSESDINKCAAAGEDDDDGRGTGGMVLRTDRTVRRVGRVRCEKGMISSYRYLPSQPKPTIGYNRGKPHKTEDLRWMSMSGCQSIDPATRVLMLRVHKLCFVGL